MSVRRECCFVEFQPSAWYLVLAMREGGTISEGPARAFGPFPSQAEAERYLDGEFSNPGGYSVYAWQQNTAFSPAIFELISNATRPWFPDDNSPIGFRFPKDVLLSSLPASVPSDPGSASRKLPLICYPIESGCFRDIFTYFVIESLAAAELLGYEIYDRSEAQLHASAYHHPGCVCGYCMFGREALSGSDY